MPSKTSAPATETIEAATATVGVTATPEEESGPVDEAMPDEAGVTLLATGDFYDIAHHGEGTASVYQLADGSRILRFEDFFVVNGPDLHVYLTGIDPVPNTIGQELAGYVDLGALKGNSGNQNYEIPEGVSLDFNKSVVIWCVPFRVPFSGAPLQLP